MVDERGVHGRHRGEYGDLLAGDVGEHPFRIEPDMQHRLRAVGDREQHDEGQSEYVEQRQYRERLVRFFVSPVSNPVIEDVDHGTEVRVRQHGPLGLAGGAAGVLQHGDLVLERPVRVAREGAVIGEERGKIELAAGPGDTIRRGAEGARDRRRQKVLDAADHQRLELCRCR